MGSIWPQGYSVKIRFLFPSPSYVLNALQFTKGGDSHYLIPTATPPPQGWVIIPDSQMGKQGAQRSAATCPNSYSFIQQASTNCLLHTSHGLHASDILMNTTDKKKSLSSWSLHSRDGMQIINSGNNKLYNTC